jgi:hypothetical protein
MRDTTASLFRWFLVSFAMLLCFMLGIQHGESLGEAKTAEKMMEEVNATAVIEYELGFKAGARDALYRRPVSEELEMVCLGLWISEQPELKM